MKSINFLKVFLSKNILTLLVLFNFVKMKMLVVLQLV